MLSMSINLLIATLFFLSQLGLAQTNFIVIIGDDISWNDLGCYGHPTIRTPNIDQLATEGLLFTNAYLTTSSCSPSRSSILTGRYPHNTGAAELHTPVPDDMATLAGELKNGGYYTAQGGKWHLGNNIRDHFHRIEDKNGNGDGGEGNWLRLLQERPKNQPFFMWMAAVDAHRAWGENEFSSVHTAEDAVVSPYLVDAPNTREDLASYYNEIYRMDHYVGVVREELERQNILENTLIVVMADNGRPFPRCKTRVYDSGMKTPFVVFWPEGISAKGQRTNSLISVIDIAPTFLDLAGIEVPDSFQGRSFANLFKQPNQEFRKYIYAEHNWHDFEAHERMVRSKHFMYVYNARPQFPNGGPADSKRSAAQADLNRMRKEGKLTPAQAEVFMVPRPAEELYDVVRDPQQLINIASVPEYQEVLMDYRQILEEWKQITKDNIPENLTGHAFDQETGELLPDVSRFNAVERGEMPGTKSGALHCNAKPGF